ncbi:alpha/beta-hydrolase [Tothia fuscella]|uniref:Alpha/beta-hydrolase n=1 Tax=Tothia fuscella TaxID=1048955 RepID=A0A9P4P0L5_9PEZI|nr:alpha/beta-hydrolase [Tothia fuscella]
MRGSVAALAAMAVTTVVAQEKACSPLHFIFARATTELPPNVENATPQAFEAAANKFWSKGYGAGGFSMFQNISAVIPGTTGYPVHYPASWSGCTSEDKGVKDMLAELSKQSAACPKQKFILGGHSQGGVVTVRTIPQIPADILAKVLAVTMPELPYSRQRPVQVVL